MEPKLTTWSKKQYIQNTYLPYTIEYLLANFPKSWHSKKCYLLWTLSKTEVVEPYCILSDNKYTVKLRKSMTKNLITLNTLNVLFNPPDPRFLRFGVAINLAKLPGLVVVDLDSFLPNKTQLKDPSSASIQEQVFNSLLQVPCYRELSASKNGVHIIFRFDNFEQYTNDRFIWTVASGFEIFVSGHTNKLLSLTGFEVDISGKGISREVRRSSRRKSETSIVQATSFQLRKFLDILKKFEDKVNDSTNLEHRKLSAVDTNSIPAAFLKIPFAKFHDKSLELADPSFPSVESCRGYMSILKPLQNLRRIIINSEFGPGTNYISRSEVDYNVFTTLAHVYLSSRSNVSALSSIIRNCVNYYDSNFPVRDGKGVDYLTRTCYNAVIRTFSKDRTSSISPKSVKLYIIKTPLGLLAESKNPFTQVSVDNRFKLTDLDLDLYTLLLELLLEKRVSSEQYNILPPHSVKCQLNISLGDLARQLKKVDKLSGKYYKDVLSSLTRLSGTIVRWSTLKGQGSLSLLEYVYDNTELTIIFTDLLAWMLLVDTKILKETDFRYVAFYSTFIHKYHESFHRRFYRFLINNSPIKSSDITVKIDQDLLQRLYPTYSTRRHSVYKKRFLESFEKFKQITETDIIISDSTMESFKFKRLYLEM